MLGSLVGVQTCRSGEDGEEGRQEEEESSVILVWRQVCTQGFNLCRFVSVTQSCIVSVRG